jgi:hypothetical protein
MTVNRNPQVRFCHGASCQLFGHHLGEECCAHSITGSILLTQFQDTKYSLRADEGRGGEGRESISDLNPFLQLFFVNLCT